MKKPTYLKPDLQGIPPEITELPQWVCWRAAFRDGGWTKQPVNPATGELASSTDPATWADLSTAWAHYHGNPGEVDGIGFVFKEGGGVVGIDFDHCTNGSPHSIDPEVLKIVKGLGTYAEHSVSGKGVHVLGLGTLPAGRRRRDHFPVKGVGFEAYDRGRFFVVTGAHIDDTPIFIRPAQDSLDQLHQQAFPPQPAYTPPSETSPGMLNDEAVIELIRRSKQATRFSQLFDQGEWEGAGHPSHSEADMDLCGILAFWSGGDAGQIDRLFRGSALMREKWLREDYRQRTINKAIDQAAEVYEPRFKNHAGHHHASTRAAEGKPDTGITSDEILHALGRGEDGDAELFIKLHRGRFCFDHADRRWYEFAGNYWKLDRTEKSIAAVSDVIGLFAAEANVKRN